MRQGISTRTRGPGSALSRLIVPEYSGTYSGYIGCAPSRRRARIWRWTRTSGAPQIWPKPTVARDWLSCWRRGSPQLNIHAHKLPRVPCPRARPARCLSRAMRHASVSSRAAPPRPLDRLLPRDSTTSLHGRKVKIIGISYIVTNTKKLPRQKNKATVRPRARLRQGGGWEMMTG